MKDSRRIGEAKDYSGEEYTKERIQKVFRLMKKDMDSGIKRFELCKRTLNEMKVAKTGVIDEYNNDPELMKELAYHLDRIVALCDTTVRKIGQMFPEYTADYIDDHGYYSD
jgi:hypothetical protein